MSKRKEVGSPETAISHEPKSYNDTQYSSRPNQGGYRDSNRIPEKANAALLDVNAVAAMLGCSARTVWRLTDSGKMPAPLKLAGLRRWRQAEIADWISAGCPAVRLTRGGVR